MDVPWNIDVPMHRAVAGASPGTKFVQPCNWFCS